MDLREQLREESAVRLHRIRFRLAWPVAQSLIDGLCLGFRAAGNYSIVINWGIATRK